VRGGKLEESLKLQELYREITDENNFLAYKLVQALSTEYGKDPLSNEKLVAKHATFEEELATHEKDALDKVDSQGKSLIAENHYDAANVTKRLAELQVNFKNVKDASEKRRAALADTHEWVEFESDAHDELNFIEEQHALLQSNEVGDSLSANLALLKKHEGHVSDLSEHGEHIQDVLVVAERLEKENSHAEQVKALSKQLQDKNTELKQLADQRKAKLEAATKVHQFNRSAGNIDAFLNANELKASSKDFGKDLASIAAQLRAISALNNATDSLKPTFYDVQKSKDSSEESAKKYDLLNARWEIYLKVA